MLQRTFVHLPGIGPQTESTLWDRGIHSWDIFCRDENRCDLPFGGKRAAFLRNCTEKSRTRLRDSQPEFFARSLPTASLWRLFADFRSCAAYLDIETTGLGGPDDHITTAALYDGRQIFHFVHGENLDRFPEALREYKVLITYNGSCFDLPFIRRHFGIDLNQVHIDLRFLLKSLGYHGGLKGCERQLGMHRGELEGVDGYFAVLLWNEYRTGRAPSALETLLAYNIADVVNLETLMVKAYNLKLRETPFDGLALSPPSPPPVGFTPDPDLISRLRRRFPYL